MNKHYEYRITALRANGDEYYQQSHYNKTVAGPIVTHCKHCPDVDKVIYERREMGTETFELISSWQRPTEADKLARMLARLGWEDITERINSRVGDQPLYTLCISNPQTHEIVGWQDMKQAWRWLRAERHYQLTGKY